MDNLYKGYRELIMDEKMWRSSMRTLPRIVTTL